jgi:hypothetical protein
VKGVMQDGVVGYCGFGELCLGTEGDGTGRVMPSGGKGLDLVAVIIIPIQQTVSL